MAHVMPTSVTFSEDRSREQFVKEPKIYLFAYAYSQAASLLTSV